MDNNIKNQCVDMIDYDNYDESEFDEHVINTENIIHFRIIDSDDDIDDDIDNDIDDDIDNDIDDDIDVLPCSANACDDKLDTLENSLYISDNDKPVFSKETRTILGLFTSAILLSLLSQD